MEALRGSIYLGIFLAGCTAWGATITGTVRDANGSPLKAAFVEARVVKGGQAGKFALLGLSDSRGQYRIENLSPGDYQISARKNGYKAGAPHAMKLADGQPSSVNLNLQKDKLKWTDVSIHEGKVLLPDAPGKQVFFEKCIGCHGFQQQAAARRRDQAGWRAAVAYMRNEMRAALWKFTDPEADQVSTWFNQVFGVDSKLPESPEDMPNFKENYSREYSDEGMKIVYGVYDLPRNRLFPFSARPDGMGKIWIPFYHQNAAGMLDPKTGDVKIYQVNNPGDELAGRRAAIHSVSPVEKVVWLAAADANKLGRLDRATGEIGLIAPPPVPPPGGRLGRGSIHDVWEDSKGIVWTTGNPLQRYDPATGKWTQIMEMPDTYGMAIDQNGDIWATEFRPGGVLGKVDSKTLKVTTYHPPNKGTRPRRVVVDSKGMVWVADWTGGAILRFDPKTETFKEHKIPGPEPTPYAIQVDKNDNLWFTSHFNDYLGKLDPQTGRVTKHPLPISSDIGSREIFQDEQGRLWLSSPPNDKIIYFTP